MKLLKSILFVVFVSLSTITVAGDFSPETVDGATTIDATGAKGMFDTGVLFIDVRSNKDWDAGRIPGAEHLELKTAFTKESVAAVIHDLDEPVVVYCNGEKCHRSADAIKLMVEWGYKKLFYFREGFPAWQVKGFPVE